MKHGLLLIRRKRLKKERIRHFLTMMLLLASFVLSSCDARKTEVNPVTAGISFSSQFSFRDGNYACEGSIEKSGKAKIVLTDPSALKGMTFSFDGEAATVDFLGLSHSWISNDLAPMAPAEILAAVFRDLSKKDPAILEKDDFVITESLAGMEYTLHFGATGLPISLQMNEMDLYADFQNVTILPTEQS